MNGIKLNFNGVTKEVNEYDYQEIENRVYIAHDNLNQKTGKGNDMLGWMTLPENRDEEEIIKIIETAELIKKKADVFIIVGIGGSYLGARAIIEMFTDPMHNMLKDNKRNGPEILYAGHNLSPKYLRSLIEYIEDKDVVINVISKSGKTLEPAIVFRMLKIFMEEKYGIGGAAERIFVTTDKEEGVLKEIADKNHYEKFIIPCDVGGRYSVLTAVGLLPMAVAGIDIEEILDGAMFASHLYNERDIKNNDCYKYAATRNILYEKGKTIEMMSGYEPHLHYFIEWYKQLFGESEGKEGKGILPVGMNFTTDLHSMGQYIQQGKRNIFETMITIGLDRSQIKLPKTIDNIDGLNYIAGESIDYINKQAYMGTYTAHVDGGVPVIAISIEDLTSYNIGQLIYFFEKACAISGYLLGINPFDQPGVEAYKTNMMRLLNRGE
ncbi:MAG: glucose-6-phosphate isomerase [Clostridia bacterium]|nr:glucose-6-phosphate isomerase [Clostridia bacterium]